MYISEGVHLLQQQSAGRYHSRGPSVLVSVKQFHYVLESPPSFHYTISAIFILSLIYDQFTCQLYFISILHRSSIAIYDVTSHEK